MHRWSHCPALLGGSDGFPTPVNSDLEDLQREMSRTRDISDFTHDPDQLVLKYNDQLI